VELTSSHYNIHGVFPEPVYIVNRGGIGYSVLDAEEQKEVDEICAEGLRNNTFNQSTINNYIFNDRLEKLKDFCEQQLKIYLAEVIIPKNEIELYITQSWLNITKPGEMHHEHIHQNSIVSGVFYIQAEEDDKITFVDPMAPRKNMICFEKENFNIWNSDTWFFPANPGELLLFPSWLTHKVAVNENATTDRISLSFNTFAKGVLGSKYNSSELILG
tara:strand:+ start:731 stop:1381 length:651 start_codon:yes stop_codon:yes gene_type:complete